MSSSSSPPSAGGSPLASPRSLACSLRYPFSRKTIVAVCSVKGIVARVTSITSNNVYKVECARARVYIYVCVCVRVRVCACVPACVSLEKIP